MPWIHPDGRRIAALYYRFADSGALVVWLNERGEDEKGRTVNADGKRLVTTQPGEHLLFKGQRMGPVESVRPFPFR